MAHIRTFAELEALPPTIAEWQLINAAQAGELCKLGDGTLPPEGPPDPERHIRAEVLRYLILGGCDACRVDDIGVVLAGAHISEQLDLDFVTARGAIQLILSRFDQRLSMTQARCKMLNLSHSDFDGIFGQAIEVSGPLFIRNAVSTDSVDLNGARIIGQLACDGANLESKTGWALNVQDTEILGGIFLCPFELDDENEQALPFLAKGGVTLTSACVGGIHSSGMILSANAEKQTLRAKNLTVNGVADLEGCIIIGTTDFTGAKITGDLSCKRASFNNKDGEAFIARRMQVAQSFIWRKDAKAIGKVILDGAHVAELDDNPQHWPDAAHLSLDGFTYDRIAEYTDYSPARKDWLHNGSHTDGKFFPQPYSQYAKFLRETGHDTQARQVLLTRETRVRVYERKELFAPMRIWRGIWDRIQWAVVGYGHAPFRSILWLFALLFIATIPSHKAWEGGFFAPNSGPILTSDGWQDLQGSERNPAQVWAGDAEPAGWPEDSPNAWRTLAPGRDWETFNRYAYAADIVIPLINFGQTQAWAPSTTRGDPAQTGINWGWHLWWLRWVFTVFGWIVTALGAAAITGIIRRE